MMIPAFGVEWSSDDDTLTQFLNVNVFAKIISMARTLPQISEDFSAKFIGEYCFEGSIYWVCGCVFAYLNVGVVSHLWEWTLCLITSHLLEVKMLSTQSHQLIKGIHTCVNSKIHRTHREYKITLSNIFSYTECIKIYPLRENDMKYWDKFVLHVFYICKKDTYIRREDMNKLFNYRFGITYFPLVQKINTSLKTKPSRSEGITNITFNKSNK